MAKYYRGMIAFGMVDHSDVNITSGLRYVLEKEPTFKFPSITVSVEEVDSEEKLSGTDPDTSRIMNAASEVMRKQTVDSKSKGEATLCLASMHCPTKSSYPIEIRFPPGLDRAERERIDKGLEEAIQNLGYTTSWIPIL